MSTPSVEDLARATATHAFCREVRRAAERAADEAREREFDARDELDRTEELFFSKPGQLLPDPWDKRLDAAHAEGTEIRTLEALFKNPEMHVRGNVYIDGFLAASGQLRERVRSAMARRQERAERLRALVNEADAAPGAAS